MAFVPGEGERRTDLAGERTYLKWTRFALALFSFAVIIGTVTPTLRHTNLRWLYEALGVAYAVLGMASVGYGIQCYRTVDFATRDRQNVLLSRRFSLAFTGALAVVAVVTFALVVFD